jgi:hypothetical protein
MNYVTSTSTYSRFLGQVNKFRFVENRPEQRVPIGRTDSDNQKSMDKPFCVSTGTSPTRPCQCRTKGQAFSSYLHFTRLSCKAMISPNLAHLYVRLGLVFADRMFGRRAARSRTERLGTRLDSNRSGTQVGHFDAQEMANRLRFLMISKSHDEINEELHFHHEQQTQANSRRHDAA